MEKPTMRTFIGQTQQLVYYNNRKSLMLMESFSTKDKQSLLRIHGEIYAGRSIEMVIRGDIKEEDFSKSCCLDAVVTYRYLGGIVDFPIKYPDPELMALLKIDKKLAKELYTITLCEEGVKANLLQRQGRKYAPLDWAKIQPRKYGKYLISKEE